MSVVFFFFGLSENKNTTTVHPDSHLAIRTLVETVDPAGQRTLCSHQTCRLSPEVLKTRGERAASGTSSSAELQNERLCFADRGKRLHHIAVVDEARVGQQGGAAEARQGSSLSSQQHQVTCGHLRQVGQATGNTCRPQRARK